jgi:hypothetical protein
MYLYSPPIAHEILCRITRLTVILWQGYFPCPKGAIFQRDNTLLLSSGIVQFRFCSFQSFLSQKQQRQ